MGKEELINEIKSKTQQKIHEKREEALKKSKEVFERAEKEAEEETNEIKEKGISEGKQELDKIVSSSRLEAKRKIMNKKEELIQEVIEEAVNRIENQDPSEFEEYVKNLVKDAATELKGGNFTVHGDKKSLEMLNNIDKNQLEEEISNETENETKIELGNEIKETGVIVEKEGGVRVNNTIKARKERILDDLRINVSSTLFGGVEDEIKKKEVKMEEPEIETADEEKIEKEAEKEAEKLVKQVFEVEGWENGGS